ncbi:MAG: prepilin-type N-terminal cleavage/methylation domain-containing protein [Oleibacter sp.]|nr:prepilin-type N-terminal cleavage/methylation domain-containing protein [Thalassolituus sp.]
MWISKINPRGFTLVELVMTIALTGIVGTVSIMFIKNTGEGLISSSGRQQLSSSAKVMSEQISRLLRNAMPGSIRVTTDGQCIEFMSILIASEYTQLNTNEDIISFDAVGHSGSADITGYASIYPISTVNIYSLANPGSTSDSLATFPSGSGEIQVDLVSDHNYPQDSPQRRFYISEAPRTLCQQGSFIYLYHNYGFISDIANLKTSLPSTIATGRDVLATNLQSNTLNFSYGTADLSRNGIVNFSYTLLHPKTSESLNISQQVRIINVP